MALTPDHHPGQLEYEDLGTIYADAGSSVPVTVGAVGYSLGLFSLTDSKGTYEPRTVYQLTHPTIADLIHYLDEGPALSGATKVTTYVGNVFVKTIVWYTDSTQAKRIVDRTLSYPSGTYATVTQDAWRVYAADGVTVAHTATDQIVSQGVLEISRTRTYT